MQSEKNAGYLADAQKYFSVLLMNCTKYTNCVVDPS